MGESEPQPDADERISLRGLAEKLKDSSTDSMDRNETSTVWRSMVESTNIQTSWYQFNLQPSRYILRSVNNGRQWLYLSIDLSQRIFFYSKCFFSALLIPNDISLLSWKFSSGSLHARPEYTVSTQALKIILPTVLRCWSAFLKSRNFRQVGNDIKTRNGKTQLNISLQSHEKWICWYILDLRNWGRPSNTQGVQPVIHWDNTVET